MLRGVVLLALVATPIVAQEDNCALTMMPATKPRYLKFCNDYNENACCIPGHDLENQIQFENLIDGLGPGCKNPMMYPNIRYFYCLGCDSKQPDFTTGDITRVCPQFVKRLWEDYAVQYKECGVMKPNACPPDMDGFDPYTCGDDLIIPTNEYADGIEFINAFKPPGMDDYTFVAAEANQTCWEPPFMRDTSSAPRVTGVATFTVVLVGLALRHVL